MFRDEQRQAVELLPRLAAKLEQLITAPIGLADVMAAYDRLQSGDSGKLKTIIHP